MRYLVILFVAAIAIYTAPGSASVELTQSTTLQSQNACYSPSKSGGDPSPWPWGHEMKFPWSTIRGSWVATDPGCDDIGYVLRARYAKPNRAHKLEKVIDVREYDRKACKIIAYGTGYETDRVVRATMIREGGESYDLTFRAFPKNNGGAGSVGEGLASSVVMTFESDDSFAETKAIELKKIRDEVKMICYDP